ncbi:hypothetical protein [Enterobacter asburiae]|uniref:hypothetical protein n=1 Tax=Enterobacter asburiae TaxID=61645 RepID=UPI001F3413AD|nr:hypothetical protein [Enterobacter asburiae]
MTITIREQVLAALRNNPGLNSVKMAELIGMDTRKISGTVSTLLADGLNSCEGKYGQRLYSLTSYGMRFAPDTIPGIKYGKSKLIQRTDTNVICQECRNSAAMKRILMVWGEGRGMSVKRYEWVACDEHSCHCDVVESAEGDMVNYEDYAALEARCAALAAENAGLKALARGWANATDDRLFEEHGEIFHDSIDACEEELKVICPVTDAFLAEVRAQGVKSLSNAVQSVISERQRQQSVEGWTPKHDDKHDNNELAFAASCYAFHSAAASWDFEDDGTPYDIHPAPKNWPWASEWWKPTNPRRDLVKAGALILAEIERIDRQEAAQ